MKRLILTLTICSALSALVRGGEYSPAEVKQVAPPVSPEWYGDNEWNVSLWGTYAMTGTENAATSLADLVMALPSCTPPFQCNGGGRPIVYGTFDKYLGGDHAWGGGADIKYFFHRYFGIGVEGAVLDARRSGFDLESNGVNVFVHKKITDHRTIGQVLGAFTVRYPIGRSRFAPYAWAGGGAIFGGGERDRLIFNGLGEVGPDRFVPVYHTRHSGHHTKGVGQFGGGFEFRLTGHIGWLTDYSWNVIDGPENNFGMLRSGINFAF